MGKKVGCQKLEKIMGLLQELLGNCVSLADESAVLIRNIFKNGDLGVIDKGGLKNYQTEGDRAVQRLIVTTLDKIHPDVLAKTFPEHLQNVAPERITVWIDP